MKKVNCANCGFMHWAVSDLRDEFGITIRRNELIDFWRNRVSSGGQYDGVSREGDEEYRISCLRKQWVFASTIPDSKDIRYIDAKSLPSNRRCLYFVKYEPGFGPEEHKEIRNRVEDRRALIRATLIGALIGAVAAIMAQLAYAIATRQ